MIKIPFLKTGYDVIDKIITMTKIPAVQKKITLCVNFNRQLASISPFNWFPNFFWRNSISLELGSYDNRWVPSFWAVERKTKPEWGQNHSCGSWNVKRKFTFSKDVVSSSSHTDTNLLESAMGIGIIHYLGDCMRYFKG